MRYYRIYIGNDCKLGLEREGRYGDWDHHSEEYVLTPGSIHPAEFLSRGAALDFLVENKPELLNLIQAQ